MGRIESGRVGLDDPIGPDPRVCSTRPVNSPVFFRGLPLSPNVRGRASLHFDEHRRAVGTLRTLCAMKMKASTGVFGGKTPVTTATATA